MKEIDKLQALRKEVEEKKAEIERIKALEKELEQKETELEKVIDSIIHKEGRKLARRLIAKMKSGRLEGAELYAHNDGFQNSYIAMCYQYHRSQSRSWDLIPDCMEDELSHYKLPSGWSEIINSAFPDYDPFIDYRNVAYIIADRAYVLEDSIQRDAYDQAFELLNKDRFTPEMVSDYDNTENTRSRALWDHNWALDFYNALIASRTENTVEDKAEIAKYCLRIAEILYDLDRFDEAKSYAAKAYELGKDSLDMENDEDEDLLDEIQVFLTLFQNELTKKWSDD